MIRSSLCDSSDAYIHVKGSITVPDTSAQGAAVNNRNNKVIFINCAPNINCISQIINKQIDHAQNIDVVMPMYNVIEYSDTYSKTSRGLWQFYRDEPVLDNKVIIDFLPNNKNSILLKFKEQITRQTGNNGVKNVKIMVP